MTIKNKNGVSLFIDHIPSADECIGNVIFCCTPVVPVVEFRKCYSPLSKYGFNVYALDFAGIGKSEGHIRNLSIGSICGDFDSLTDFISSHSQVPVFLFADTGIGGIIGQYYAAYTDCLSGLAQFGSAVYKDASPLGISKTVLRLIYPVVCAMAKLAPGMKLKAAAPNYNGYHADLDNRIYQEMLERHPDFFKMHIQLLKAILDILCAQDSAIGKEMSLPTLVFKTTHDRYFPQSYFDKYYKSLGCAKKLVTIDDVHNSYYLYPDAFAKHVAEWFIEILNMKEKQ